jgi:argininosuccinate lyase
VVGGLVREAEAAGVQLGGLSVEALRAAHPELEGAEVQAALDPVQAVERRSVLGGPSRSRVAEAIQEARSRWAKEEA